MECQVTKTVAVPTAKKGQPIARNQIARILLPLLHLLGNLTVQRHLEVTRMEYHMVIRVEGIVAEGKQQVNYLLGVSNLHVPMAWLQYRQSNLFYQLKNTPLWHLAHRS